MILLDTCALLWLAADQKRLSATAKKTIGENTGRLFVSAISAFEIAVKSQKGKLVLPLPARAWFERAIDFHGIYQISIDGAIAASSVELPPHHNDPCDRFIIATAVHHAMPIVTRDNLIVQYNEVKVIW